MSSSLSYSRLEQLAAMPTNDRIGHMTKQEHDDLIEEVIWRRRQASWLGQMNREKEATASERVVVNGVDFTNITTFVEPPKE